MRRRIGLESHAETGISIEKRIEQHSQSQLPFIEFLEAGKSPGRTQRELLRGALGLLGKRDGSGASQPRESIDREPRKLEPRESR